MRGVLRRVRCRIGRAIVLAVTVAAGGVAGVAALRPEDPDRLYAWAQAQSTGEGGLLRGDPTER
jgi:hypothetical protein